MLVLIHWYESTWKVHAFWRKALTRVLLPWNFSNPPSSFDKIIQNYAQRRKHLLELNWPARWIDDNAQHQTYFGEKNLNIDHRLFICIDDNVLNQSIICTPWRRTWGPKAKPHIFVNLSANVSYDRESFPFWDRWGSSGFNKIGLIFSKAIIFAKDFSVVGSVRWPPQENRQQTWVGRRANKCRQIFLQAYFKKKQTNTWISIC